MFSNPINCQFWHQSCIWLEELPQNMVSYAYLIFRNKWDIKHFLFLLTFSYHWEILYKPHCQQCWVKFAHAVHVILQLIHYKLWSKTLLHAFQPYKLPIVTSKPDATVMSELAIYGVGKHVAMFCFITAKLLAAEWHDQHGCSVEWNSPMLVMSFCS